jgi:hypothetical protein
MSHQEVDRRASPQDSSRRNYNLPATQMLIGYTFVKDRGCRVGSKMRKVDSWVHNCRVIVVVSALFDEEDREIGVSALKTAC